MTTATKQDTQEVPVMDKAIIAMPDHFYDILSNNVCERYRLSFVARQLKGSLQGLVEFESSIYRTAKALCFNSNVAGWDISNLSGIGGFYMQPKNLDNFYIADNNNYHGNTVDYRVFGIIVTLKAFSELTEHFKESDQALSATFKTHFDGLTADIQELANYMQVDEANIVSEEEKEQIMDMYKVIDRFT